MKEPKIVTLEPDEYKTGADIMPFGGHFIPRNAILITKDNEETMVQTVLPVDPGCRIRVKRYGNGVAGVKHLTSTPRRKYYAFIRWLSVIMGLLGWIITLIEILVNGNYATGDSRTNLVMLPAFIAWLGLNISILRNDRGFTKWFATIFGYLVLFVSVVSFIRYFAMLIQGY